MKFEEIAELEKIESDILKKKEIKVSIFCLTYNHKQFIKNAIEGFINQKVDFDYEIIIFDDASTDGTSEIVRSYALKYPNLIRAHLAHKNTYNHPDIRRLSIEYNKEVISGKYVALCEGDDYWIYDRKLQKQYEWMEEHLNITLCVHNSIRYDAKANEVIPQIIDMDTGYIDDEETFFCSHGRIPTASFFYRAEMFAKIPPICEKCLVADDPLRWWLAYCGDVFYMDKVWSVRNYMHEGSWNYSRKSNLEFEEKHQRCYLQFVLGFDKETNYKFHSYLRKIQYDLCESSILLRVQDEYDSEMLKNRIKECKSYCNIEGAMLYEKVFVLLQRGSNDYCDKVIDRSKEHKGKFYIYGAGIEAKKSVQLLEKKIDFQGFVISAIHDEKTELMGYPIKCFNELKDEKEICFWLCMNEQNRREVLDSLFQEGFFNVI